MKRGKVSSPIGGFAGRVNNFHSRLVLVGDFGPFVGDNYLCWYDFSSPVLGG